MGDQQWMQQLAEVEDAATEAAFQQGAQPMVQEQQGPVTLCRSQLLLQGRLILKFESGQSSVKPSKVEPLVLQKNQSAMQVHLS